MRRVALHRLDEVRDEVVAPRQLDVDLTPRLLHEIALPDETVVRHDRAEHDERQPFGGGAQEAPFHDRPAERRLVITRKMISMRPCDIPDGSGEYCDADRVRRQGGVSLERSPLSFSVVFF